MNSYANEIRTLSGRGAFALLDGNGNKRGMSCSGS